ncbi:hypothetical protein H5410_060693, partial [Solanum commersonii]
SPYESHLSNLEFSKFPRLCFYSPIVPPCENLPISTILPYYWSINISESFGFKSRKKIDPINRIEKVAELTLILTCEPTPSNFIAQISITQNDDSGLPSMEKQLWSPNLFNILQDMIRKEVQKLCVRVRELKGFSEHKSDDRCYLLTILTLTKIE